MNDQRQMKELRETARDLGIVKFDGDRRKRETWEQAIERQAQIMDIPLDAAYNSIFRTVLLGSRNRVGFEVIEQALELVQRHCFPFTYSSVRMKQRPVIFVSFLAFELACKALPGVSFENIPGVEIEVLVLPESSDTLDTFPAVEIEAQPLPESSDTLDTFPAVEIELVILSDRFVATYAPPQVRIHFQVDADGQLSLLDFQVESVVEEAPDIDDFESLDAFREAIALWDFQHPIDISLDSFSSWAPCPDEWYEPIAGTENSPGVDCVQSLPESFDTLAASPGVKLDHVLAFFESSSTSDFFIPVFGCDRPDEPPTAGVGARLPKPKPPSFSPSHPKLTLNAYQTHSCFVGGTVGHLGRSPPGGDAMA